MDFPPQILTQIQLRQNCLRSAAAAVTPM